ncbi:hypothetical protein RR46_05329 [Papilio xuthus]|uniref:Uncharacterized protein n=1 Tax=Papilio xuthus TaxID=66420 RepID=A0A194Q6R4_PAPXU|nr:hypothetical protein RR46_05329 [Papilio xuthus]
MNNRRFCWRGIKARVYWRRHGAVLAVAAGAGRARRDVTPCFSRHVSPRHGSQAQHAARQRRARSLRRTDNVITHLRAAAHRTSTARPPHPAARPFSLHINMCVVSKQNEFKTNTYLRDYVRGGDAPAPLPLAPAPPRTPPLSLDE